jgi:hypothetical protein
LRLPVVNLTTSYQALSMDWRFFRISLAGARNLGASLRLFYMTTLSGQADFGFYTWARVLQTVGLPFVFIPITAVLTAEGMPAARAPMAALQHISQVMMQQATLPAYIDVFKVFAIVALLMAPVALILLRPQAPRPAH